VLVVADKLRDLGLQVERHSTTSQMNRCFLDINTYSAWCDSSLLSEGTSVKLATNIHYESGHYWKGFQGQRSNIKVMIRTINL